MSNTKEFNPLVSIVIPVYNGSNFLREAIDSALAQTYENLEIIVVNDGSEDDTESIALSYGDKIRYFAKENGGTSTALNMAIENMEGDYFSWLSHDDLYYPEKIEHEVDALSKLDNKDTIIICDVDGMTDHTRTFTTAQYQEHRDAFPSRNDSWLYPVIYNKTHGCTHLISKKVFETVGLFDVTSLVAHDFEFYYRAFAKFPHFYLNEVLVTARDSSNRQGKRSHARGNIEYSLLYIDILDHLSEEEIKKIAPSMEEFLKDMEFFFYYADYTIALDYVEIVAENMGIKTNFGRRDFTQEQANAKTTNTDSAANMPAEKDAIPQPHIGFWRRVKNSIKKNGIKGFIKNAMYKIKNKARITVLYIPLCIKNAAKRILPARAYEKLRIIYRDNWLNHKQPTEGDADNLPFGINLFAYNLNSSAGMESHLLQAALTAAAIPYQIIDLVEPEKFKTEQNGKLQYCINLIVLHAASETPKRMQLFNVNLSKYYNIGYWAWELDEVPDAYCAGIEMFQEIWTLSEFCTKALEKKARMPVLTVPTCANPDRDIIPNGRDYFKLDKNAFLFMFAYDCNSFVARKNPQAVVQAFMNAFSPEDTHVGLVLKLIYPENYREHIEQLLETLSPYKNIYYIDRFLSDTEMRTLVHSSDAFVTLHRSEGFGLLPLEAMSLGTPVIATGWSGNMEYMNHMNTALVGYTMVPVNGQYAGSVPDDGLMWADADVTEAAEHMRRMVSDENWRKKLVAQGHYTADYCYNAETIGKIMRERLKILGLDV